MIDNQQPEIKIKNCYKEVFKTKKRYILLTGGRGSGKSFFATLFALLLLYEENQNILFTRYTMQSAFKSIIPEFQQKIDMLKLNDLFYTTKTNIFHLLSKSGIMFSGIKTASGMQTANLKSLSDITTWIYDEAEESEEEHFDTIDLSIRTNVNQNRVILVMNPCDREHWIYKRFVEKTHQTEIIDGAHVEISTHPDVLHIHTSYLDNIENLSESFLKNVIDIKVNNKRKYQEKIIGAWASKTEGVIFNNVAEGHFDSTLPYCYAQDYGFSNDPTTLVKIAINKKLKKVYVHECFYNVNALSTEEIYELNRSYLNKPKDLIVADSAEPRLIEELQQKGLNIIPCVKGQGSVTEGIASLLGYQIIVTPESHNVLKEFRLYKWNDKKAGIPIDDHNHTIDPIRYGFKKLNAPPMVFI